MVDQPPPEHPVTPVWHPPGLPPAPSYATPFTCTEAEWEAHKKELEAAKGKK